MAFLTLPVFGDVKVRTSSSPRTEVSVGEVRPAYSGAPRSSVSSYRLRWRIETEWYTRAEADSLRTALKATPPIAVTGTLAGSINVFFSNIQETEKGRFGGLNNEYARLGFDMWAA